MPWNICLELATAANLAIGNQTMHERHTLLDTIMAAFVPVHRDGHKFIAIGAVVTLVLFWLWQPLGWLSALVTAFIAYFFRDPERATPVRPGLAVAAADGKISFIETRVPPPELGLGDAQMTCISTFLSIFDVHINRSPVSGKVISKTYTPGVFGNAGSPNAGEENERLTLGIETDTGEKIGVVQITGLIARRIVCYVKPGDRLMAGERFGVDVYLPLDKGILAAPAQRTLGGETVLADFQSQETGREVRVS
jgi:phosphatidylserine decarboxylase